MTKNEIFESLQQSIADDTVDKWYNQIVHAPNLDALNKVLNNTLIDFPQDIQAMKEKCENLTEFFRMKDIYDPDPIKITAAKSEPAHWEVQ